MAGAGYKLFNTGDVLTAAQVNTYLMEQTVMVFADAAARTSALSGVLTEGMVSYLKDTNAVEKYDGSAWVALAAGDISAVNVTAPITGGGSSGDVTIGIQDATTTQKGAVQLEDSTSSTSTTKAATPNSVKSAYDLANAAIAKSLVDAAGDLIYATADNTVARLGIGTAGQVLTVNSGATAPIWAAAAGGGKVLQVVQNNYNTQTVVASTSYSDTGLSVSITPSSATSKILIIISQAFSVTRSNADNGHDLRILRGATDIFDQSGSDSTAYFFGNGLTAFTLVGTSSLIYLDSPNTTSATTYKTQGRVLYTTNSGSVTYQPNSAQSTITLIEVGA